MTATVEKYGGTYSMTRELRPRWHVRLRRWARERLGRPVDDADFVGYLGERIAVRTVEQFERLYGGRMDYERLFGPDEAFTWACRRERILRREAMRCAVAAGTYGDDGPGSR